MVVCTDEQQRRKILYADCRGLMDQDQLIQILKDLAGIPDTPAKGERVATQVERTNVGPVFMARLRNRKGNNRIKQAG
jgi:hypothetical protein